MFPLQGVYNGAVSEYSLDNSPHKYDPDNSADDSWSYVPGSSCSCSTPGTSLTRPPSSSHTSQRPGSLSWPQTAR